MKRERRFLEQPLEVLGGSGEPVKITGYAAKFAPCRSDDLGGFVEEIAPGAFDEALADGSDCVALWNHNDDVVLGRKSAGTLRLSVDEVGLRYEIDPPDTQQARDLMVSLRRRDVQSSSFGFTKQADTWYEDRKTGQVVRRLDKVSLFDVSPTTYPAYKDTSAQARSLFPDDKAVPAEITEKIAEVRKGHTATEKRYRNIRAAISNVCWAITPEKLETIGAILDARSQGVQVSTEEVRALMGGTDSVTASPVETVAVIPVLGPISQRMTLMSEICGGASIEGLTQQFRAALNDESVKAIVFDVDSPGGTVTGVPEFGAELLAARGRKPIVAVANGLAASAAYWIASACDRFVVTPSGQVGSIGVYCTHQDLSGMLDKEGVKVSFIQAGKYKTDGNPYEPLSDSARANMQKSVNDFYNMFVEAVATGRGVSADTVESDFGQGRVFHAVEAQSLGMVDAVDTLDAVIAGLLNPPQSDADTALAPTPDTTSAEAAPAPVTADVNDDESEPGQPDGTCGCDCDACVAGDCGGCTDPECDDDACSDCSMKAQQAAESTARLARTQLGLKRAEALLSLS